MEKRIDLHVHTAVSDGTDSPEWVVSLAHALGLAAIAVTDHDTVSGLVPAIAAGEKLGVEVVPGTELAADWESREVHVLGYFIDAESAALGAFLARAVQSRIARNQAIIQAMAADGLPVSVRAVQALAPDAVPGRPHIAQLLIRQGLAADTQDAFRRYLGRGGTYYRPRELASLAEAAEAIRAAGGVASLAHPMKYGLDRAGRERLVSDALAAGCAALEAYYAEHTPSQQAELLSLAGRMGMAVSGGSDYHGARRPRTHMGTGVGGGLSVPYAVLEGLRARRP